MPNAADAASVGPALVPEPVSPAGGEGTSIGGIGSQLVHVFAENRLAIVGAVIIVVSVLFCFVGPLVYHTNQSSTQNALLYSTQNAPPSRHHLLGTTFVAALATVAGSLLADVLYAIVDPRVRYA